MENKLLRTSRTFSIALRIVSMVPIAFAGISIVAGLAMYNMQNEERNFLAINRGSKALESIQNLRGALMESRISEKELFIDPSDDLFKKLDAELEALKSQVALIMLTDIPKIGSLAQAISDIKKNVNVYNEAVAGVVAEIKKRGANETLGLQGALREAVHEIEGILRPVDQDKLKVSMLMLRRHEKDFIMRVNGKYVNEFDDEIANFTKTLADSRLDSASIQKISAALRIYSEDFHAFASETLALEVKRQDLNKIFAESEPLFSKATMLLRDNSTTVAESGSRERAQIFWISVSMTLASTLTVIIASLLIGRSVSRPIKLVTNVMDRIANGHVDTQVDCTERSDEIGIIARALEKLRNSEKEKRLADERYKIAQAEMDKERHSNEAIRATETSHLADAVETLGRGLKRLADGDLSVLVETALSGELDRLRIDYNNSVLQFRETIQSVVEKTSNIERHSVNVQRHTYQLANRTEQQAASLEETSAALEQISTTVRNTSSNTIDTQRLVNQATGNSERSEEVVIRAVDAMRRIEDASSQIGQIISVINEIAFQTNLLALNAGVEAARAGEAGKGFAVVAQEVRELAQRSAKAASEIRKLISASSNEVSNGVNLVRETGEALSGIRSDFQTIENNIQDISRAAGEQATGLGAITSAIAQLDQFTQQNASMTMEANHATSELSSDVYALRQIVSRFKLVQNAYGTSRAA